MIKRLFYSLFILSFLLSPVQGYPSNFFEMDAAEGFVDEIIAVEGELIVISISDPTRVGLRNPEIVEITKVAENEILLVAKKRGNTVLTIWDKEGKKQFHITVNSQDLAMIKSRLMTLINKNLRIPHVTFKDNEAAGRIVILGEVTAQEKEHIDKILSFFIDEEGNDNELTVIDNLLIVKEEYRMVEVDCHILELTKSVADSLGFKWTGTSGAAPLPVTTVTEYLTGKVATSGGSFKDIFRIVDWTRTAMDVQINASSTQGKGKILARPKLLCLSGEEADFLVGGEIPVVSVTSTTGGDTVAEDIEYEEYGVKLSIRPEIIGKDDIKLSVSTEVRELSTEGQYVRQDGTIIKAFTTRNASTVLRLKPDQGIVISGLLKDKVTKDDISKVPGLSDIPILGALFRSRDYQDDQTELIITLTPRIIDNKRESTEREQKEIMATGSLAPLRTNIEPKYLTGDKVLNDYILGIKNMIYESLTYPHLAEEAGWQGVIKLRLHIKYNGELIDVKIIESSGYSFFDENAVGTVRYLSPYPQFPVSADVEDLWIDIPVFYKID